MEEEIPTLVAHPVGRFRGEAAFGKDRLVRQTFSGVRVPVRLEGPGVIIRFGVAPTNAHELTALQALAERTVGTLIGERTDWSPATTAEGQPRGMARLAPYRSATRDAHPRWSAHVSRVRYRIDTVFAQLVECCAVKRVARDLWHLSSRLLRTVLMPTLAVLFNSELGNPPLHLTQGVAS